MQTFPATNLYSRPLLKRERRAGARPYEERSAWDVHSPNLQLFHQPCLDKVQERENQRSRSIRMLVSRPYARRRTASLSLSLVELTHLSSYVSFSENYSILINYL